MQPGDTLIVEAREFDAILAALRCSNRTCLMSFAGSIERAQRPGTA